MKRKWQAAAYLFLYFFVLSAVTGFEIGKLFDVRSFLTLTAGALLLTLPFYRKGMKKEEYFMIFGSKSIDAGLIQVFLLVFIRLSDDRAYEGLLPDLAMCFRPMLYAFCIRMIFEKETAFPDGEEETETGGGADGKDDGETVNIENNSAVGEAGGRDAETVNCQENDGRTGVLGGDRELTAQDFRAAGLTNREAEIALMVCRGCSNREIAQQLFISEMTVKKHISNIFEKTGIKRREALKEII